MTRKIKVEKTLIIVLDVVNIVVKYATHLMIMEYPYAPISIMAETVQYVLGNKIFLPRRKILCD